MKSLLSLGAAMVLAPLCVSQAPMDDALWAAGRQGRNLTKVSRCGDVLQTVDLSGNGFDLRSVSRAPNGDLWVVNFITTTMTILDRTGGNLRNITVSGTPFAMAFDKAGNAWVGMSNIGMVEKFSPAGVSIQSYPVSTNPLGISIDTQGNVWVAHRNTAPGSVTKIDPLTNTVTNYPLPAGITMMPIAICADFQGPSQASHIWVTGDGSNQLVELDNNGVHLNTYPIGTSALSDLAVDRKNNLWVSSGVLVHQVRYTDGAILSSTTLPAPAQVLGLSMDALGRPWVMNRVSFSGPQPSTMHRIDPATGAVEVFGAVGIGGNNFPDANGFHFAYVVDQFGDADGDGTANLGEVLGGTSPYDAQSNPKVNLEATGITKIGNNVNLVAGGAAPAVTVVYLATKRGTGITIPGISGQFLLDPLSIFGFTISVVVPGSLALPIPNDASLDGAALQLQGLYIGASNAFTNLTCVKIWM